jgi:predicted phage terminase large subunit-like protein
VDAVQRLAARLVLEDSLLDFTRYTFKRRNGVPFIVSQHHEIICNELQALVDGQSVSNVGEEGLTELLIINMPPRYGKTELAVINFIAWCLARNPAAKFIHLSYADKLAMDNSSQVRELMKHEAYRDLWDIDWKLDADAKGLWKTNSGGGMMASPAGGTITGFGAGSTTLGSYGKAFGGAIVIDDPLKPDDARSDVERSNVNERLVNTIMSRRNSRETPIILIMQRLHEEDMTGFALSGKSGLRVRHVKLAAILPNGTPLWPHKHTLDELERIKVASPYTFSGQYQQEPAPEEGIYFKRDMFREYDTRPEYLAHYGASDFAVTEGAGDYTVHGVFGVDHTGDIYLVDLWRKQTTADVWVETLLDMADKYKTKTWAMESGVISRSVGPLLKAAMHQSNRYPNLAYFTPMAAKDVRARNIQGRMAQRGLYIPKNRPWVADLLTECINFPNGKHDDQVDVLSLFGNMVHGLKPAVIPEPERKTINTAMPTIEQILAAEMRKRNN